MATRTLQWQPALLLVASVAVGGCASSTPPAPSFDAFFEHGAVAADHPVASEAGADILRAGGNAVDAAVATSFTLSVVRPYSCGIGGGGFMVIHLPADPVHGEVTTAINYRETAPAAVGPDFYADGSRSSTRGADAVGVPGTVAGLLYALERYGTMDRAAVLAPAIRAAEEGFEVDRHYAAMAQTLIAWFEEDGSRRERFPLVWKRFLREGSVEVGDRIVNPRQAAALRLIAEEGASAFYDGSIGDALVRRVAAGGGVLTRADLLAYEVEEVEPLRFRFREREAYYDPDEMRTVTVWNELITMPPPSSGGIALAEFFGLLDRVGEAPSMAVGHADDFGSARWAGMEASRRIEAFKHAFADRARWLGDPDYVDVPVDWLLSDERLDELAGRIVVGEPQPIESYGSVAPPEDDHGTSHLSVGDRWGGAVACTETINLEFGSLLGVDEFGFVLNDEMDDFTAMPGEPNAFGLIQSALNVPEPGKRPLSSMSPTIVLDENGAVFAAIGASGGPRIITSTAQMLLELMAEEGWTGGFFAMLMPRLHHQWLPDVVWIEPTRDLLDYTVSDESGSVEYTAGVTASLRAMGYEVRERAEIGNVQVVVRLGEAWEATSDPRKGGRPAGY